jgi:hypothetical protein
MSVNPEGMEEMFFSDKSHVKLIGDTNQTKKNIVTQFQYSSSLSSTTNATGQSCEGKK